MELLDIELGQQKENPWRQLEQVCFLQARHCQPTMSQYPFFEPATDSRSAFTASTLVVGRQEEHLAN